MKNDEEFLEMNEKEKVILEKYKTGMNLKTIASELGMSLATLKNFLDTFKKTQKTIYTSVTEKRIENIKKDKNNEIYDLYQNGMSKAELSRIFNIQTVLITELLEEYVQTNNLTLRNPVNEKKILSNDVVEEMLRRYYNWERLADIARDNGITPEHARILIKKIDPDYVEKRTALLVESKREEIRAKYESGLYLGETATINAAIRNIAADYMGLDGNPIKTIAAKQIKKLLQQIYCTENIPLVLNQDLLAKYFVNFPDYKEIMSIPDKSLARERLVQKGLDENFIIPKRILDSMFSKQVDRLHVKRIKEIYGITYEKYLKQLELEIKMKGDFEEFIENPKIAKLKKYMGQVPRIVELLTSKEYSSRHLAVALLQNIIEVTRFMGEEIEESKISELVDGDEETLEALKILNIQFQNPNEYMKRLKNNELAKEVKLSMILDECKTLKANGEKINPDDYEDYVVLAKNTAFYEDINRVLNERNFSGTSDNSALDIVPTYR